jgi:cytochrome c oxidase assembly protein subunit 15
MPFDPVSYFDPNERRLARDRVQVSSWLFVICGMFLVMIALGGATRLTGSGLSIMEWAPLEGIVPPITHADWAHLYALYQQTPQYRAEHAGFGIAGFQHIFWLEWIHRFWGRLIGVVFIVPLVVFAVRRQIPLRLVPRLVALFVLGGLQGAVGWFMVYSGFFPDNTSVAPARLVIHLTLALALYAAILWTGLSVRMPAVVRVVGGRNTLGLTQIATGLTALTIVAGGFVAGTHAGFVYNTFPLMGGQVVPAAYATLDPFWRNLFENTAAVQFDHRVLATLTAVAVLGTVVVGMRARLPTFQRRAVMVLGAAVACQYLLGVTTLVTHVPVALGTLHQSVAVLLLSALVVTLHSLRGAK